MRLKKVQQEGRIKSGTDKLKQEERLLRVPETIREEKDPISDKRDSSSKEG